jgi:hypothetical protein
MVKMSAIGAQVKRRSQKPASCTVSGADAGCAMKTGVEKPASSSVASRLVAIAKMYPIRYRLSPLRERLPPAAGHRAPPPRESYRRRFVNVTIFARPRRSVGRGYV